MRAVFGAAAVLSAGASATVTEFQCSAADCTGCKAAQTWQDGKCYGVGNQAPYHVSQKAHVSGNKASGALYTGDSCAGAPFQTDDHELNKCVFFTGQIWTKFVSNANATLAEASPEKCSSGCCTCTAGQNNAGKDLRHSRDVCYLKSTWVGPFPDAAVTGSGIPLSNPVPPPPPADVYTCDPKSMSCVVARAGTPGAGPATSAMH
eukprot:gene35623-58612_t